MLPVEYGFWKQKELWDGTYTIDDLLDILPAVLQKANNSIRTNFNV